MSPVDFLISIPAFIVALGVVVFVHEFGHFQVARWCKVAIDTFAIGFGRTILGWRDKQGVLWKIGMLPLGGYVKFEDDTDPSSTAPTPSYADEAEHAAARKRGLFHAQSTGVRALVAFAGPASNFIFSILAFSILFSIVGKNVTDTAALPARVDAMEAGSAAERAQFKVGDLIVKVDGKAINSQGALREIIAQKANVPVLIEVKRAEGLVTLKATPTPYEQINESGITKTIGRLGLGPIPTAEERKIEHPGPIGALGMGLAETWRTVASTGSYVGNIFTGKASAEHISGPLGILQMSGQVAKGAVQEGDFGTKLLNLCVSMLGWAAVLSVAVGIVNLLPVPVLDGGHILFCAIEAIQGRPLDAKAQAIGFQAGLAALASLFLFATWNDLQRLNVLEFLRGILS